MPRVRQTPDARSTYFFPYSLIFILFFFFNQKNFTWENIFDSVIICNQQIYTILELQTEKNNDFILKNQLTMVLKIKILKGIVNLCIEFLLGIKNMNINLSSILRFNFIVCFY